MEKNTLQINKPLLAGAYIYLSLPIIIFAIGWCKWYIGLPVVVIVCLSVLLCLKQHRINKPKVYFSKRELPKCLLIIVMVMCWVGLSGIGGYVWQNSDHWWRNAMFDILVTEEWPVKGTVHIGEISQERGFVYYIGFWLPAAVIGKICGHSAGYAAQYIWAVLGILLLYSLICMWRKKILLWPLLVFIFFSGADILGTLINSEETVRIWGIEHLERWPVHYQFSSITTQLFWVFNQAVPAWLACALIFLLEKPRNLIFVWSLILVTSTLPFAGLFPFIIYFLIRRSEWENSQSVWQLVKNVWKNWGSVQNILGGGCVGGLSLLYLLGNVSGNNIEFFSKRLDENKLFIILLLGALLCIVLLCGIAALVIRGYGKYIIWFTGSLIAVGGILVGTYVVLNNRVWNTYIYKLLFLSLFYFLEVGLYLILLKDKVKDKCLYFITVGWLFITPLIIVGDSLDFCMRASIPALILIMLWCIETIDCKKMDVVTWGLIGILLVGSVTPIHEIKRTFVNTREEYILESVGSDVILMSDNFSGDTQSFFWKVIAK